MTTVMVVPEFTSENATFFSSGKCYCLVSGGRGLMFSDKLPTISGSVLKKFGKSIFQQEAWGHLHDCHFGPPPILIEISPNFLDMVSDIVG